MLGVPGVASPLGAAYVLAGRTADALPLLEQAVEQAVAVHFMLDYALQVVWLGEAYLHAGRLDEAYTQAQSALEFSQAHRERGYVAYALQLLGEIAAHQTPPEAEDLGMGPLQAHCHRGLGTLYTVRGQLEQARAELSTAIGLHRAMDMTFWLPQAEAALAYVGAISGPRAG